MSKLGTKCGVTSLERIFNGWGGCRYPCDHLGYLLDAEDLSSNALAALDQTLQAGNLVYVASISLVEVAYLVEKQRLPEVALERLNKVLADINAGRVLAPLDLAVAQAIRQIPRDIVPDMPDRIIAATALYLKLPLVTCDQRIQAANIETLW